MGRGDEPAPLARGTHADTTFRRDLRVPGLGKNRRRVQTSRGGGCQFRKGRQAQAQGDDVPERDGDGVQPGEAGSTRESDVRRGRDGEKASGDRQEENAQGDDEGTESPGRTIRG